MTITIDGTTGITFPDSSAQVSAAALEFITTIDISDVATVEFTGFDATRYDSYMFSVGNLIPANDAVNLWMRTSTTGGAPFDSDTSDYGWAIAGTKADGAAAAGNLEEGDHTDIKMVLAEGIGSATGEDGVGGDIIVHHPHLSKNTFITAVLCSEENTVEIQIHTSSGFRHAAEDVDAVQFLFSAGNIESGTITMYGRKNS